MPVKHSHKHKYNLSSKNGIFNFLVYFVSVVEPLSAVPQIYNIWFLKQTQGVSLLTWLGFLLAAIVWLLHGISCKDKALIISSTIWIILESLVILGLLFY